MSITKKKIFVGAFSLLFLALMILPSFAFALTTAETGIDYATQAGLPSADIRTVIAKIIKAAMGLLGIVAVVIVLLGGFKWMTAGGEEEKVGEAKKLLGAGIIGLVIVILAYAIANFVITALITAST